MIRLGFQHNTILLKRIKKIKSSLYSWYYAETCNESRTHLRCLTPEQHRNAVAVARLWRECPIWPARELNPRPLAPIAMS